MAEDAAAKALAETKALVDAVTRNPAALAAVKAITTQPSGTASASTHSDISALKSYFGDAEKRRLEQWRPSYEKATCFLENAANYTTEKSNLGAMLSACRNALLTEEDVMALTYLLCAHNGLEDHLVLSAILLRKHGPERILTHNWWVAKQLGEPFLSEHGAEIMRLTVPLFHPAPPLSTSSR